MINYKIHTSSKLVFCLFVNFLFKESSYFILIMKHIFFFTNVAFQIWTDLFSIGKQFQGLQWNEQWIEVLTNRFQKVLPY